MKSCGAGRALGLSTDGLIDGVALACRSHRAVDGGKAAFQGVVPQALKTKNGSVVNFSGCADADKTRAARWLVQECDAYDCAGSSGVGQQLVRRTRVEDKTESQK